jgi:ABC-2 type transport system ATP-binding protein
MTSQNTQGNGVVALSVSGLGKRFGDRVAFDNVSFDIGSGEVFGFLGPMP